MRAVILAGGQGVRLQPYATIVPKPLMPVGNFPIAEIIVRQLCLHGFTEITMAVGHLRQLVEAYFGNGARWGIKIEYLDEQRPLGTVGPLAQLEGFDEPLLLVNGDILTDLNFAEVLRAHASADCDITIATFCKTVGTDLGVIKSDETGRVVEYTDKPRLTYQVNMGIAAIEPAAVHFIPENRHFDMADLVRSLNSAGRRVQTYQHEGIWLDVGRTEDYLVANDVFERHRAVLLPAYEAISAGVLSIDVSP
jgi:NDP-mannose synthase